MNAVRKCALPLLMLAAALPAFGQTKPADPNAGNPPPRAGFDPAAIRERILSNMKDAIDCSDDEWKVIEPKLIKVILLKIDAGALGQFNRVTRNGTRVSSFIRTLLDPNAPPSPVDTKLNDLDTLIAQSDGSADAYHNKVAELRRAREEVKKQLDTAEQDVIKILTVRQEAALVELGVLE